MKGTNCLFIGGGPLDGMRMVPDNAGHWNYYTFDPPRDIHTDALALCDIRNEKYYRVGPHLFMHESEVATR